MTDYHESSGKGKKAKKEKITVRYEERERGGYENTLKACIRKGGGLFDANGGIPLESE